MYPRSLPKPFFVLAPMDDVTDTAFRQVIADCTRPDLSMTEFVNVDGLQSPGRERLLHKLKFTPMEQPLIAQVWGKNPENYYKTAQDIVRMGFAGLDINMGCPVKAVVQNGCCSALINNRGLTGEIIQAAREGAHSIDPNFPISVKTRLGFKDVDLSWQKYLLGFKLNMLTVHGRTVSQMSKVPTNWDLIGEVVRLRTSLAPETLIVGNGDVKDRAHGATLAEKHGVDGIMIGRGIFDDPYAFAKESPWQGLDKQARLDLYTKHVKLFLTAYPYGERKLHTLNKFCKVYIQGFPGAKELREKLMNAETAEELLKMLQ